MISCKKRITFSFVVRGAGLFSRFLFGCFVFVLLGSLVSDLARGQTKISKAEVAAYCSGYFEVISDTIKQMGAGKGTIDYALYSGAFRIYAQSHGLSGRDFQLKFENGVKFAKADWQERGEQAMESPEKAFSAETRFACRFLDHMREE